MQFKKANIALKRQDERAFIRRVMWLSLDERIEDACKDLINNKELCSILGNIHLDREIDKHRKSKIYRAHFQNCTRIRAGVRFLGFCYKKENNNIAVANEKSAQLWYSQAPAGGVFAFLAPYESELGSFDEEQIIVGLYKSPSSLTKKEIKKHLSLFVRYCIATSQNNNYDLSNYIYRQRLKLRDYRFRSNLRSTIWTISEKVLMLAFATIPAVAAVKALQ